jgi:glyoxylase-like metal-dependent hydrolase (beta-lactamase superfamily II)
MFKFCSHKWVNFTLIQAGDFIEVGDYYLECISAPGHTEGLHCLYEPNKKILIPGDHILGKITPNIQLFSDTGNPLKDYLNSLDKVYAMQIELVLPAHRSPILNHRERINQLKTHHHNRAQAIMSILGQEVQNAYEIASQMNWDMSYKSWDQFPVQQKWFATGEVIAHLRYLEEENLVNSEWFESKICYSLI